jgi:hypothetical protein
MSDEDRIEDICYYAYQRGDYDQLIKLVIESEKKNPHKQRINHFEYANFKLKTSYMLKH